MWAQTVRSAPRLVLAGVAVLLIWAAVAAPASAAEPADPPLSNRELIERLQAGGLILIIRHERTEAPSRRDDYSRPPDDCRAQRNLSVAGAAGAQETGVVLRALDIGVGRVISSPMCRSAETARYMFGVDYELDVRLMHHDPEGERTLDVAEAESREVLSEIAPGLPDTNIALIGHGGNIFRVSGLRLSDGEIGVLLLDEDGEVTALGQFTGSDLAFFARRALEGVD